MKKIKLSIPKKDNSELLILEISFDDEVFRNTKKGLQTNDQILITRHLLAEALTAWFSTGDGKAESKNISSAIVTVYDFYRFWSAYYKKYETLREVLKEKGFARIRMLYFDEFETQHTWTMDDVLVKINTAKISKDKSITKEKDDDVDRLSDMVSF